MTQLNLLEERLRYFEQRLPAFDLLIGGWPPNAQVATELSETKMLWQQDCTHAEALLQEHPSSLQAMLILANLLRMGHNIDIAGAAQRAEALFKKVLAADPKNHQAMLSLARLYLNTNPQFAPEAERLLLDAESLVSPTLTPEIHRGLAFANLDQAKHEQAVCYFEKYLQSTSTDKMTKGLCDYLKSGGRLMIQSRRIDAASDVPTLDEHQAMLAQHCGVTYPMPTDLWRWGQPFGKDATPQNFYQYGLALCHYKQDELALVQFERAIELAPDMLETYQARAGALLSIGKITEALQDLNFVIQRRPTWEYAYNTRGLIYLNTQRNAEALLDFSQAIHLNPAFGPAYYNRALVLRRLGQIDEAIQDLQTALTLEPYCSSSAILEVQQGLETLYALQDQQTARPSETPQPIRQGAEKQGGFFAHLRQWFRQ